MSTMAVATAAPPRVLATVRALTRVEGVRLVRHPVFLAGAALSVAGTVALASTGDAIGGEYFALTGAMAVPVALATLIAANLSALRSRRSNTGELYRSLAAPARARTLAHVLAVAGPGAASACLTAAGFAGYRAWDGVTITRDGATAVPSLFELAQGPVAVMALGVVGVALARWLPYLPVAPVAAVGLLAVEMPATQWNVQSPSAWFAPLVNAARTAPGSSWPCSRDQPWPCVLERFASDLVGWHLLYLAGIAVALGAAALLRHGWRPRYALAGAIGLVPVVVGGILQLP